MNEMISLWVNRDPRIVYDGYDLKKDLQAAYAQAVRRLHHHLSQFQQASCRHDL